MKMVIKGSLIDPKTSLYGAFHLSVNLTTEIIEQCEAVISSNSKFLEHTNPKQPFYAFAHSITRSKFHPSFLQTNSIDLQKAILKISRNDTTLQELCEKLRENSIDDIKKIFLSNIRQKFKVGEFTIKIFLEKDEHNSVAKTEEISKFIETKNKSSTSVIEADSIFVDFKLLIDPINGYELKEIKQGDYIKVQLILNTTVSHSVANNYSLIDENNNIKPSIVKVITTKYKQSIIEILVELVNGVCGYIREESNILIKVPSKSEIEKYLNEFREKHFLQDEFIEKKENLASKKQSISKIFILPIIFAIFLVISLWFLIILLLDT